MIQVFSQDNFFNHQRTFPEIPFSQSFGWYAYTKGKGLNVVLFQDAKDDPNIMCWGREQVVPVIKRKILLIEGECISKEVGEDEIKSFYSNLISLPYVGIEINSNNGYNTNFEVGIRRAGFKRPLFMGSCPLTIKVNLSLELQFNRNWIRNVKKATDSGINFCEIHQINDFIIGQFLSMFKEMSEHKRLGYQLNKASLIKLLESDDMRTFFVYSQEGVPLSARVIHEHNGIITDVYAANSYESRNCGASFYLMDNILKLLKAEGKALFDFGRIPPSNNSTDSVYVFKKSSGGVAAPYNGEWVHYKNGLLEYSMLFYKKQILKKQRY